MKTDNKNANTEAVSTAVRLLRETEKLVVSLGETAPGAEGGKMLSVKEFCRRMNCSKPSVFKYIREGRVRAVRLGGLTRIPESELLRLLMEA